MRRRIDGTYKSVRGLHWVRIVPMKSCLALVLVLAASAHADDIASVVEPRPSGEPLVEKQPVPTTKPRPDQASGVAQEDDTSMSKRALWVPRALLFLPRTAFWLAVQPVRGVAWATEHYDLLGGKPAAHERWLTLYPTVGYESTYGITFGARAGINDLFGADEKLRLRASWGGEFRYGFGGRLSSGDRFGRVETYVDTAYEIRGRERFHGIGDGHDIETPPAMPIDPTTDSTSIRARFSEELFRTKLVVKTDIAGDFKSRVTGAYVERDFGHADSDSIEMRYQTDKLVGFTTGVRNVYVEHELAYDSRRPASPYATQTLDGTGWLVSAYGGLARGVDRDPTRYFRYGGEVQRYIDLYDGTRILVLRGLVDAVAGTDGVTDGRISFVELPRLGGSEYLRGYASGRFRDRAVVLGTAEYSWQVSNHLTPYAFFDIGGPMHAYDDTVPTHFGYGGGLQVHSRNTFYMRTQFAVSREGDFFLDLVFSPAFGRRERAGRF